MPLEYYLTPNRITPDSEDYMAVSVNRESYTIEDVYDHMTREGSTLTKAEALASFEEITRGIINILQQGDSVSTPFVNLMPTISGVFIGEDDRFDLGRHQVRISVSAGSRLRKSAEDIDTKKVSPRERQPELLHYFDNTMESKDEEITISGGARITGTLLKFDETDDSQGIFFINTDDGSATRVDSKMMKNKPSELIFMNPALDPGTYRLEVRTILNGNNDIRSGVLSEELTVSGGAS
ncbi:DNA-binding domain-containing protein [Fodinibius salsisoli]|uniref:DUF4469 domain-containing protein n=1 Tax=Fodinibius salsisoli TaxID=2820877 RepID=A0ABT3PQX8_9BACT|nr:DNA-binding domain-containing protein [Fodinibius salsisoli]MCW9708265.1 DUF4469 domain-containing protein [Fodinibius salsisoli]